MTRNLVNSRSTCNLWQGFDVLLVVCERDAVVEFEHVTDCVEELNGALVATNCRFRQSFVRKLDQLLSGGAKNIENRQDIIIGSFLSGFVVVVLKLPD